VGEAYTLHGRDERCVWTFNWKISWKENLGGLNVDGRLYKNGSLGNRM